MRKTIYRFVLVAVIAMVSCLNGSAQDEPTYKLTVSYDYDNTFYPYSVYVIHPTVFKEYPDEYINKGVVFNLPEGTYDVFVKYVKMWSIGLPANSYYVIKENIRMDKDTTIVVNPNEAINKVEFKFILPSGERAKINYRDWQIIDNNTGEWLILESGNVWGLGYFNVFKNKDKDARIIDGNQNTWLLDSPESNTTFYINDVSDKWELLHFEFAEGKENYAAYATCFDEVKGVTQSAAFENDPNDFDIYELHFSKTAYGKSISNELYHLPLFNLIAKDDRKSIEGKGFSITYTDNGDVFKYYLGKGPEDEDILAVVEPEVIESRIIRTIDYGEYTQQNEDCGYIFGTPFVLKGDNKERISNGAATFNDSYGFPIYKDASQEFGIGYFDQYAYNEPYCYKPDKLKGIHGANVPIIATKKYSYDNTEGYLITRLFHHTIGRYGEFCTNDIHFTNLKLKKNGETVSEMEIDNDLWWGDEIDALGEIEITLTCNNRIIDELQGENKTVIHYDQRNDDATAPALQMLHFKDTKGYITDRFVTAADGYVEFSGGDYNEGISEANYLYFDRAKSSVMVSYSPYRQDDWNEIYVEENSDYYSNLTGWFYRGSLADVEGESENGWFDLKIRLTDEAGNWQEQIISPAFRIDDRVGTGINEVVKQPVATDRNYFSLDGKQIDTPQKGINIVRKANGDIHKVVVR